MGTWSFNKQQRNRITHAPSIWLTTVFLSMAQRKTAVTPLLTHWSYCSLTLSHRYEVCPVLQYTPQNMHRVLMNFLSYTVNSGCCISNFHISELSDTIFISKPQANINDNRLKQTDKGMSRLQHKTPFKMQSYIAGKSPGKPIDIVTCNRSQAQLLLMWWPM